MKKSWYTSIALIALLLLIFLYPGIVNAASKIPPTFNQPIIEVSPVIFPLSLAPGKKQRFQLTVHNVLGKPLPLHTSLESFFLNDEDSNGPQPPSLTTWTRIEPHDMILDVDETRTIDIVVTTPRKVPVGGYYGNIYLEPKFLSESLSTGNPPPATLVQPRIAVLMLGSIGVPHISSSIGKITTFSIGSLIQEKPSIKSNFEVKNISLYHFSAKPFIKIQPIFGELEETEIGEKIILPGRSRKWDQETTIKQNRHAFYKVSLVVSVGNGEKIIETKYLVVFPFIRIALGFGAFITILFIIRKQGRIMNALKILFGRKNS